MFNNPTKQARYGAAKFYALPGGGEQGDPMPHGGVNQVPATRQAAIAAWPIPQPGGSLPTPQEGEATTRPLYGFGSTRSPGQHVTSAQHLGVKPPGKGCTSFVGVATCGSAAPVW